MRRMASCKMLSVLSMQRSDRVAGFVFVYFAYKRHWFFDLNFDCRPLYFQQEVYNGKDCVHALKFQTVMMADGIIAHVSGPWSGRRHDTHIFQESGLPSALADLPRMPIEDGGELMALYADPGYALSSRLFMPYPDGRLDALHCAFNRSMASNRISVEWGYGRVSNLWRALNFSTELNAIPKPDCGLVYLCRVIYKCSDLH